MQTQAVRLYEYGGASNFRYETVELSEPQEGEVTLKQHAIGLNYIDVYHRTGLYPTPDLPCVIGMEASGTVTAIGKGVTDLQIGDRVAYATMPLGAYCAERNIAADRVAKLPDSISLEQGAAMMLQGMTAEYLLRRTFPVQAGDTILYHAAAGGVGLILCQWAKKLGATVIGTVGNQEKAELARLHGCDHTILYKDEDVVARVKDFTDGKGVSVVYDGVGKDTWTISLDSLKPRGMMVSFGNASGMVPAMELSELASRGSLFLTRPSLMTYTANSQDMRDSAAALFEVVGNESVKIEINQSYALSDAAQAHKDLEARKTTGSSIMLAD